MSLSSSRAAADPVALEFDLVINGGSFSAPAAALEAARIAPGLRILVLEPTDWLGGQATSQGVAAIDNAWHDPGAKLMRENPSLYYPADYLDFLQRLKNAPPTAPGEGFGGNGASWVSREAYDPRTAAWVLDAMLAEQPGITVMKMTVLKAVETAPLTDDAGEGLRIVSLQALQRTSKPGYTPFDDFLSEEILDWYDVAPSARFTKQSYTIAPRDPEKGLVVIDASELADAIVLSGATYVVGREATTETMNEDGTPPAMNEEGSQSFVYPFCMTDAPGGAGDEADIKTPFPDFAAYYAEQLANFFSLGTHSWPRVWTYRRLRNTGTPFAFDTVNPGDVTMQNWYPGNDYPYGTLYKDAAATAAETADWRGGINAQDLANAEKHALAFYFYMKAHPGRTVETRYLRGAHPLNMMGTRHGLSKFPYIRETRRLIGLDNYRLVERYFVDTRTGYEGGSSFRFYDSVGIGNYAVDVHPTVISRGIGVTIPYPAPFYVPYRALGSANVRNLLAAGKTFAGTFVTNAAYRLHPIEWAIGNATGVAAAMMVRDGKTNYDLLDLPTLRELQTLVARNSPISWAAYDADPLPPHNGDLVLNDNRAIQRASLPFPVEVYHHRAVRARLVLNGVAVGETETKANGRLVAVLAEAPDGTSTLRVECLDADGAILDTLSGTFTLEPAPEDNPWVVDDSEPEFSVQGAWIVASAQPDKFGETYHYAWGGDGSRKATWRLHTPYNGKYEVAVWYPAANNRATNAPFTVHHADGETVIEVNQRLDGGRWVVLGEFPFTGPDTGRVVLTNAVATDVLVVADAVRTRLILSADGFMIR